MRKKLLNIKQIRYFAAVVEHGSLSAAAKGQFVTVQAVSKAIADLERELGQSLFVRESRGVRPTSFGSAFHQKAESVLKDFDGLEEFASRYQESQSHAEALRLALCSPAFFGYERALASIAAFAKKGLGLATAVELENGEGGLQGLRDDVYDALITIGSFSHAETDCVSVGTVIPGVIMAKDHPLAAKDSIALSDLASYPISSSADFDNFNDSIVTVYRKRNLDVRFVQLTAEGLDRHLANGGVTLIAYVPVLGEMHPGTVVRPVSQEDAIAVPICLVSLKGRKSPSYCAFEQWVANALILLGGSASGSTRQE